MFCLVLTMTIVWTSMLLTCALKRAAEHSEGLWLNGLPTGKKTTVFYPLECHWIWKEWKWPKRSAQTPGLADGLVRRKTSGLHLKKAMIQTEPKKVSAARLLKVSWPKSQVERSDQAEGTHCTWLIFSLLMIKHVFFTPAVTQCSCMVWNHCHILPTGAATFCIGVKLESY